MAPRRAMAKAAPAPAPATGAGEAATSTARDAEARREAGEPKGAVSARQRAIEAAVAHAVRISYDTRTSSVEAGDGPVGSDAWLAANAPVPGGGPSVSPALAGRTFWVVRFLPRAKGGDLTVFVEDGSFRVLGEIRGK
jgi:hypothetical protein